MRNVYIVGPSCGGKTSLLHFLKERGENRFNFPLRVISRPPRTPDDSFENTFMSQEDFIAARALPESEFFLSWHKVLDNDRKEFYGFFKKDLSAEKVNILSANNALLLYPESRVPASAMSDHSSHFIACMASEETRMKRLKERSPEYSDAEVEVRIYKESIESYLPKLDLVVDSDKETPEESGQKALDFLNTLA